VRQNLLEEGYISSTQGSSAVYTPLRSRKSGRIDIVAVIVPVHNPFFMSYYRAFEKAAEEKGILVMIKQLDSRNAAQLENVLFSLFLKGIRDVVFWPYDTVLNYEYIERISGLGMNVIFFDTGREFRYCDYISVDNRHAVSVLYQGMRLKGCRSICYIGWDNPQLTSNVEREAAFCQEQQEGDRVIRLPWMQEKLTVPDLEQIIPVRTLVEQEGIDGFLCGNGHIGIALRKFLNQMGYSSLPLSSIDNFEESENLNMTVYEQSFKDMGQKTFELLLERYNKKEQWCSGKYYMKGRIIER
jgi:DNA-binding LacI/PurR family transcriptional regulator